MIVISDASPIIALCKAHCLDILKAYYKEVLITEKVYKEVTNEKHLEQKEYIERCLFIKKVSLTKEEEDKALEMRNTYGIHGGESEAIALCIRDIENSFLLVDDRKATKIAKSLNIKSTDTKPLLKNCLKENIITEERYSEIVDTLLAKKQISKEEYHEMKKLVSQQPQTSLTQTTENLLSIYEKVEKEYSDYINKEYQKKIMTINSKHNNNSQPTKEQETLNTSFIVKAPEKH